MTGYKRVNYYELCRLCTSSQPKDKIHIFREEGRKMQLQQKIQSCFPLLVCEHDYLPKVVCMNCVQQLEQCYTFRQSCVNSESMLSSYFNNYRFTDDFKKFGKVYVKDTGQKLETQIVKKPVQETEIQEGVNQQFYSIEVPSGQVNKSFTKISVPNTNIKIISNEYFNQNLSNAKIQTTNQSTSSLNCSMNPHSYKIDEQNVDYTKNNLQSVMYIDMDQLIDSGLPETEVNKLKDMLMKQQNTTGKTVEIKNELTDGTKTFKCDVCDKMFKRREHLYQHTKLHSGLRPFNCVHCTKTFSRKEHLMRHLTSHSGKKDFSCDICNKKFSRPDNLKKHKKTHQKSGPFVCEICQKTFVVKHYYLAHKMQHQQRNNVLNISKVEGVS